MNLHYPLLQCLGRTQIIDDIKCPLFWVCLGYGDTWVRSMVYAPVIPAKWQGAPGNSRNDCFGLNEQECVEMIANGEVVFLVY